MTPRSSVNCRGWSSWMVTPSLPGAVREWTWPLSAMRRPPGGLLVLGDSRRRRVLHQLKAIPKGPQFGGAQIVHHLARLHLGVRRRGRLRRGGHGDPAIHFRAEIAIGWHRVLLGIRRQDGS